MFKKIYSKLFLRKLTHKTERILTEEPIVILTSEKKQGDEHMKLLKPQSFDPIEIINEINKFCEHKIELEEEDVEHIRDSVHVETSALHANQHLHGQKDEL